VTWTRFVVSVCDYQHCTCTGDAAAKELEKVESRFVGPLHVFEYDGCWGTVLQVIEYNVKNDVPMGTRIDGVEKRSLGPARYVM